VPPDGFEWVSQGVEVYRDEDSFTVDLGQVFVAGSPGSVDLSESLSVQAFDDAASAQQAFVVFSSTYTASLDGIGSVLVLNLDGAAQSFNGDITFAEWEIEGAAAAAAQSDQISNANFAVGPVTAARFSDGVVDSLGLNLGDVGVAPTGGETLQFDFVGSFDVDVAGGVIPSQLIATGSAFGSAEVQTVYERFALAEVAPIPEPTPTVLLLGGLSLLLARRSR